jgi:hypothetical protein
VYLWRAVTPLLRPIRHVILDYSTRIPNGAKIRIERDAMDVSADRISELIAKEHIQFLRHITRPRDFLKHIDWMRGNTSILVQTDFALVHYVAGDVDRACEMFRELEIALGQLPPSYRTYIGPIIKALAD